MRSLIFVAGCLVLMGVGLAAADGVEVKSAPLTWEQAALTDGKDLYAELCAVCHGVEARGDGPAAPSRAGQLGVAGALAHLGGVRRVGARGNGCCGSRLDPAGVQHLGDLDREDAQQVQAEDAHGR